MLDVILRVFHLLTASLIRCLDGEALTFLLVVLPLLLHRLSLAAVSGAPLWLWGMGSSLQWLLLLGRRALGMWAQ